MKITWQNLSFFFRTTGSWSCWWNKANDSVQSRPALLQPEGYPANTPILAGRQGLCVEPWLLKPTGFIEAAPVQALHSRPYLHGAYAHVVQYQRATWTACLICFPAESPERDLCQKTNLSLSGSASTPTSASSCATSRLSSLCHLHTSPFFLMPSLTPLFSPFAPFLFYHLFFHDSIHLSLSTAICC